MDKKPIKNVVPVNIAALHRMTDGDSTRYALGGIHLIIKDGKYVAEATDTRCAIRVSGDCITEDQEKDTYRKRRIVKGATVHRNKSLDTPQDIDVVIHATDIRKAVGFSSDKKKRLGVFQNCKTVRLAVDGERTIESPIVEGRFPRLSEVIPSVATGVQVRISPALLIKAMSVAGELVGKHGSVLIEFRTKEDPLVIRGENLNDGQEFVALVMPLSDPTL